MNADIQQVAILIHNSQRLLLFAMVINGFQAIKASNAMVYMSHIIARLQVIQLLYRQRLTAAEAFTEMKTMVSLKNLVVSETADFQIIIDKALFH